MENSSFYNKIKNCIHVVEPKTIVQSMLGRQPPRQQQQQNVPVTRWHRRRSTFSWKPSCLDSCPTSFNHLNNTSSSSSSSVRRYYVLALFVIQSMLFLWTASSSLLVLLWWYNSNNSSMDYVPRSTPTTTMENNNILPPPATTTTNNNTTSAVASRSSSMSHDHLPFPETTSAAADTTTMSHDHHHYHHHHAIPNNLIFTHKYNLLQWTPNAAMDKNKVPSAADRLEMQALRDNVQHSIALHTPPFYGNTSSSSTVNATWQQQPPPPNVYFWTNDDCRASLQRVLPALVPYFDWEDNRGMIQADMCRGAALYEYGGLYLDVDLGVRRNLWTLLQPTTTFVTVRVHRKSRLVHAGFFQAFCGATPRHPILQLYLLEFLRYYQQLEQQQHQQQPHGGKKQPKRTRSLPDYRRDPLGVIFLKRAYDQFLASTTNDRRTSAQHTTMELWQEVDSAELLQQPSSDQRRLVLKQQDPEFRFPDWNPQKRACRMIVLARVAAAPPTALPQLLLLPPQDGRMPMVTTRTKPLRREEHRFWPFPFTVALPILACVPRTALFRNNHHHDDDDDIPRNVPATKVK
ncbi:hypothetical protein ACA910_001819 [Epithemia clementina (nom. ined.)]